MNRAHGRYELDWQGTVLVLRIFEDWNDFAVQQLQQEVLTSVAQRGAARWALLTDAREWGLATPAALEAWQRFVELAHGQGLGALVRLMPSHFHEVVIRDYVQRTEPLMPQAHRDSLEAAWAWLQELGFTR
ncbi:hypothetical protein HNQ51_002460 [Inhella inkyongensis]|uniref:STAS/SEC14 domain-containing protein n=1 Tax=Inhella inkyongensis TaxID=392593 RepID=A0A840S9E2_9BURK|nr:hypothetical protein [Inhella inkyongensis]MBB5205141.1 hypothetical protein [Inhella inkyongensis]